MVRKFLLSVIKRRRPITMAINHRGIITQNTEELAIQINKCEVPSTGHSGVLTTWPVIPEC
ncbi:hypothetical protein D5F51_08925 [Yersinia hibernica]|uniref:Uncharacterized protein n=2 Tax=Yersinia TaxID=629 RepID=A0ABX5QZ87_9GAMM|nr:hypothetical protein LC20_07755 [Yersinia hibernica]OVZ79794.1 hypothetical protein CBW54_19160 [Yersinia kristensenii]QAX78671.1 hypothetical protein D5F51_08925 [Yersinia hibernica]